MFLLYDQIDQNVICVYLALFYSTIDEKKSQLSHHAIRELSPETFGSTKKDNPVGQTAAWSLPAPWIR